MVISPAFNLARMIWLCVQRRVYTLFRGMGLRCLPVLKLGTNEVEGLITRQDLSHVNVHEALAVAQSEPRFIGAKASMGESHTESFGVIWSRCSSFDVVIENMISVTTTHF